MSFCLNPDCPNPQNPLEANVCESCGSLLQLRNRYKPIKSLGKGGFGATFLAVDLQLPGNPTCVIKQLRPAKSIPQLFQMARELFEREAQTLGSIGNHPQVPRLLDYFEDSHQFYLVQEYVRGNNLQREVKKNGPFSEAGVRQFLSEILPMIQYIHSQEVIHRDIKPSNLIRREQDKQLVLIDFGAVKNRVNLAQTENSSEDTALTAFSVGTPGYAPPEQMAMRPVYASDIYAIGVTCIYLLTGKSPKNLAHDPKTGEMLWEQEVHISNSFAAVIRKMMDNSVRHRYQSAEEVLSALEMEPYMEDLAKGLIDSGAGESKDTSQDDDSTSNSTNSRLASAIRARRDRHQARQKSSRTPLNRMSPDAPKVSPKKFPQHSTNKNSKKSSRANMMGFTTDTLEQLTPNDVTFFYAKGRRDFTQLNLISINLSQTNLSDSIFRETRLMRANLQGANLTNVDFSKANLSHANLRNATMEKSYLSFTNLTNADLRGADLSHAYFKHAIVDGANLCGANLTNAKITDAQLKKAKTNWATIMPNGRRGLF